MLYAIVALLVIIADQWVKYWVSTTIALESTGMPFIPGVVSLVNLHNDGCALSMFSGGGARIYFIILTGIFTVAVIIALATKFISGRVSRWSIVLVTAGGLSNCIDRIIYGYVQDMFKLELFNFPIFNVADIFITICCIIFVIAIIFEKDRKDELDEEFIDVDEDEDAPRRKFGRKKAEDELENEEPAKPLKGRKKAVDNYEQYKAQRAARQPAPAPAPVANRSPRAAADASDPFAEWEKANARVEAQQANSYAAKAAGIKPSSQARYTAPAQQNRRPAQPTARPAQPAARPAQPAARPAQPAARPAQPAARPAQPAARPVQQRRPAPQGDLEFNFDTPAPSAPAQPFAPAPETVQRPAVKPETTRPENDADFSLDDILNEFK